MRNLSYAAPLNTTARPGVLLVLLPIAAIALTLLTLVHNMLEEPFGVFRLGDASLQVCVPLCVLVAWFVWLCMAWRQRSLSLISLVTVTCWGAISAGIAFLIMVSYFKEPWNW